MNEGLTSIKFLKAEIENFKNIQSKVVNIAGRSLVVVGGNGKDKSSFIQALLSPLDSDHIPSEPIKEGEEKSTVKVKIGGELNGKEVEYLCTMFFTPGNKKGRLLVERPDGEQVNKPATVIKNIVGNISFDIFDFLKLKTEKQIEILKNLTGKGKEIDLLSIDYKRIYEERTEINRQIKDSDAVLLTNPYSDDDIDRYSRQVNEEPIRGEMEKVGESLNKYIEVENKLNGFKKNFEAIPELIKKATETIDSYKKLIAAQEEEIKGLEVTQEELAGKIKSGDQWLLKTAKPDSSEILSRLTAAQQHNNHVEKIKDLSARHAGLIKMKNDALKKSQELDKIEDKKRNIIKDSNLPVEGLSFTDTEVLYNGLPLEINQINTAKIIEIGVKLGIALNPNLKVIFIKDGSLLDKESLEAVIKSAEEKGYQAIIECVDFEGGECDIEFTEDFLVKKVNEAKVKV